MLLMWTWGGGEKVVSRISGGTSREERQTHTQTAKREPAGATPGEAVAPSAGAAAAISAPLALKRPPRRSPGRKIGPTRRTAALSCVRGGAGRGGGRASEGAQLQGSNRKRGESVGLSPRRCTRGKRAPKRPRATSSNAATERKRWARSSRDPWRDGGARRGL